MNIKKWMISRTGLGALCFFRGKVIVRRLQGDAGGNPCKGRGAKEGGSEESKSKKQTQDK